jgi:hypothetical protein
LLGQRWRTWNPHRRSYGIVFPSKTSTATSSADYGIQLVSGYPVQFSEVATELVWGYELAEGLNAISEGFRKFYLLPKR